MFDPSKFIDYPTWAKILVALWALFTAIVFVAMMYAEPKGNTKPKKHTPTQIKKTLNIHKAPDDEVILLSRLQVTEKENRNLKEQLSEETKVARAEANERAKKRAKGYSVQ